MGLDGDSDLKTVLEVTLPPIPDFCQNTRVTNENATGDSSVNSLPKNVFTTPQSWEYFVFPNTPFLRLFLCFSCASPRLSAIGRAKCDSGPKTPYPLNAVLLVLLACGETKSSTFRSTVRRESGRDAGKARKSCTTRRFRKVFHSVSLALQNPTAL